MALRIRREEADIESEPHLGLGNDAWQSRAHEILTDEITALEQLRKGLDHRFSAAVKTLLHCRGKVVVTGIGKAGIVAQKFSASLSSTGTPSHFLHPAEAVHGDLGCVCPQDVVVFFSYSGETEEVIRLISLIDRQTERGDHDQFRPSHGPMKIALTRETQSSLAKGCDVVVPLGRHREACALGLAPSTSTTLMIALSDALALVLSEAKAFTRERFGDFHPGGSLGQQLRPVLEVMRPIEVCRVASQELSIREVFVRISRPGRRTGAIMLTDDQGHLTGIFTDSDLARILEQQRDEQLDQPVREVMTQQFRTIGAEAYLPEAIDLMAKHKISELPVLGKDALPLGLLDITDLVQGAQPSQSYVASAARIEVGSQELTKPASEVSPSPRLSADDSPRKAC